MCVEFLLLKPLLKQTFKAYCICEFFRHKTMWICTHINSGIKFTATLVEWRSCMIKLKFAQRFALMDIITLRIIMVRFIYPQQGKLRLANTQIIARVCTLSPLSCLVHYDVIESVSLFRRYMSKHQAEVSYCLEKRVK